MKCVKETISENILWKYCWGIRIQEMPYLKDFGLIVQLCKDVFRYGRNTQFWLLQLREDLISLHFLHQLVNLCRTVRKYLSSHVKGKTDVKACIILRLVQCTHSNFDDGEMGNWTELHSYWNYFLQNTIFSGLKIKFDPSLKSFWCELFKVIQKGRSVILPKL